VPNSGWPFGLETLTAGIEGDSFNLIDQPLLTAREYLAELQNCTGQGTHVTYRPIWQFCLMDVIKWPGKVATRHPDRVRVPSYFDWEVEHKRPNLTLIMLEMFWNGVQHLTVNAL
jgi:hypothetical protein